MTDCSSIQGSTSSSSDVTSSRGGVVTPRIRIIRLVRPNSRRVLLGPESNASFGFAIRGGKEFGTGFFVSRIEKGSEADVRGLRVGDQIIRANGYHIEDAVHKEFSQFVASQDRLTLKVRGVGMLPVKDKTIDPLTWHIVPHRVLSSLPGLEEMVCKDVRIVLKVAPRTKLGLGICKGPEWKPGIYVQYSKDFSVAKDAGLRPGDQILSCNSIDFSDVLFSEAVAVMKSSSTLEMIVRTGAGLDLFPGESSGYNSSASSVTGDQSPCWGDQSSKRLSIVREESCNDKIGGMQNRNNLDRRKTISSDTPHFINRGDHINTDKDNNKTIIQLSDKGTLINNTLISNTNTSVHLHGGTNNVTIKQDSNISSTSSPAGTTADAGGVIGGSGGNVKLNFTTTESNLGGGGGSETNSKGINNTGKIADICFVSRQSETKTVIVEVHRSAAEDNRSATATSSSSTSSSTASVPAPPPKPPVFNPNDCNERCPSVASSVSSCGTTSLCSAISEELKKRKERLSENTNQLSGDNSNFELNLKQQPKRLGNPSLGGKENEVRHNALMDEFKRAHRKMFKNGFTENEYLERQQELSKATVMRDEVDRAPSINGHVKTEIQSSQFPTPPPPPQFANGSIGYRTYQNGYKRALTMPDTPSPDYDSTPSNTLQKNGHHITSYTNGSIKGGTIGRVAATEMAKANGDIAELESIESFKLQNPSSPAPRPPPLYFAPLNSGPPTMKKTNKSVSVTIGEYGYQGIRKEPSKFDFISKTNNENGHHHNHLHQSQYQHQQYQNQNQTPIPSPNDNENVSEMLRSELEKTLSRSNLKNRNEKKLSDTNIVYNNNNNNNNSMSTKLPPQQQQQQQQLHQNNLHHGPLNGKPILQKTQSSNIEKLTSMLRNRQSLIENNNNNSNTFNNGTTSSSNRVTISIPSKQELRKTESTPSTPTNGILKNGFVKNNFGEKNITFGN